MKKIWGHWVFSNTCFRIETPNASTTCVMYAGATDTACGGTIGYEVCFGNDIYQPGIGFGYDLSRRMRPHVTLTAPSVLFNNDDDDKTIDDDRAPVRIGFESDPFYQTNGTLRITAAGVTLWASQDASDRMPLGTTLTLPDFSTQSNLTLYVDRTGGASQTMDDLSLTLEWIEGLAADGEAQFSSNGAACVVHTMTALEPVLEPIFYQLKNIGGTNHVINPCCVVHGGRDAWFAVRNIPDWFPRNRIVWSCDDPAVQFVGGNTGTSVCVRATGPTQYGGEDYPALSVQIGDACSSRPKCHFATVPEMTTIRLYPHIVTERKSPISFDQITNMVNRANDIYSQIGIRFVMDPIDTFKLPSNVVNVVYASADSRNRVRNLVNHTRGIDVFFVDRIIGTRGFSDPLGNKVVCDASKCVTGTLAHEIGHTFGLDDVFYFKRVANGQYYKLPGELVPETTLEKYDRSGATGIRYYSPNALWASVTARCIMCSGAPDATRLDIPMGSVRGFVSVDRIRQEVAVGVANVGLSSVSVRHINDIKEQ